MLMLEAKFTGDVLEQSAPTELLAHFVSKPSLEPSVPLDPSWVPPGCPLGAFLVKLRLKLKLRVHSLLG